MGSYSRLTLNGFEVQLVKNEVDPLIMTLFQESDKKVVRRSSKWAEEDGVDEEDVEYTDGDDRWVVHYAAPVRVIRDRLELMGFTLAEARRAFEEGRLARLEEYGPERIASSEVFEEIADVLEDLTFDRWTEAFRDLVARGISADHVRLRQVDDETLPPLQRFMLRNWWGHDLGFPSDDTRLLLRAALEACSDEAILKQDMTDLVAGGWADVDDEVTLNCRQVIGEHFPLSHGDADIREVAKDILGLTKLNYNACKLGDAEPVTVGFSDAVGEILIGNPTISDGRPSFKFYI